MRPSLVLYQPDIPGNTGTLLRLGTCLDIEVHIVEPAGFRLDEKAFRRAGMDYLDAASMIRHKSWHSFDEWSRNSRRRLVLLTTKATQSYLDFDFAGNDLLLLGRESSGVPEDIHQRADQRISIPMGGQARSINMALAAAMVLGEALRQTG